MKRRTLIGAIGCLIVVSTLQIGISQGARAGDEPFSRMVLKDGRGDVWRDQWDPNTGEIDFVPTEQPRPTADVTRAVAYHGPRMLHFRMRLAALKQGGNRWYSAAIRASDGETYIARLYADRLDPKGFFGLTYYDETVSEVTKRCRGVTRSIDYPRDVVTFAVPRSCLGNPRWVRVMMENAVERSVATFYDNPHNHAARAGRWSTRIYQDVP